MKAISLVSLGAVILLSSGCMTCTVIDDARNPKESDNAPWANYLLLPITIPADVLTSPIQLVAFISYATGERPHSQFVPIDEANASTNASPPRSSSPKDGNQHD